MKEDGSAGPYEKYELSEELFKNPEILPGTWVREKNYSGYNIIFKTGIDENIETLNIEVGKDFEMPTPTKVKEGYHFAGWSKTQDGEIIKDKTNLGKKNETITLYAKWEKNPPVSTNTPVDENDNPIFPPIVDDLPEYIWGTNPIDSPVNEKPEYTGTLSTNTPVDDKGELVLPPVVDELPKFTGSVNSIEPPVTEKPEYTGTLSTNTPADDKSGLVLPPVVDELPNNKKLTLEIPDLIKPEEKINNKRELPNTNSSSVISGFVSSIIGTLGLGYRTKRK